MKVEFKLHTPPVDAEGAAVEVEYVDIEITDKNIVSRVATDADRNRFKSEYAAFLKASGRERPVSLEAVEPEKTVAVTEVAEPKAEEPAAPAKRSRAKAK